MAKILYVSNFGHSDGFGRIAVEPALPLSQRGHEIVAVGLPYDGLLPPQYDGKPLPFWVAALNGRADWPQVVANLVALHNPDVVIVLQDFPYLQQVRYLPLDWSKYAFIGITPVDGVPFHPEWLKVAKLADGMMTISEFGVQAFKQAGVHVDLLSPGVNPRFKPLSAEKRLEMRGKLGIAPDAFVAGAMCMNQGRKSIPQMMKAFFDFALDKPTARLLLDMDKLGGLDLPALIEQQRWDAEKVIFREDALKAGVMDIAERFGILDAHMVLSFREGYGLPLAEAMACGVVSIAQDYCSGAEIVGDNRGILIPSVDYFYPSGWGGAEDKLPDYRVLTEKLQWLYDNPLERAAMAERGRKWTAERTWDKAADALENVINRVLETRRQQAKTAEQAISMPQVPSASLAPEKPQTAALAQPDGVDNTKLQRIELVESRPAL